MDLIVDYNKAKDSAEAFEIVKNYLTPANLERFKVKSSFDYRPDKGEIEAHGKGFSMLMRFNEGDVEVTLKLSLFMKAFKAKILASIEKLLKKEI